MEADRLTRLGPWLADDNSTGLGTNGCAVAILLCGWRDPAGADAINGPREAPLSTDMTGEQWHMSANCWDFKKCGRQPGGSKALELGVCAASTDAKADGLNGGHNGGRICWALTGTLCGGKVQGTFAEKLGNCMECEFYKLVRTEQGKGLQSFSALQARR